MPRPDPGVPPPLTPRRDLDLVTEVREYELITPLMGGGVRPHEADPVTVVRAPSIRGQLRFWWRATRAGQFASLEEMKRAEAYLWGAASTEQHAFPALVQLVVQVEPARVQPAPEDIDRPFEIVRTRQGNPAARLRRESRVPQYAAFPLQPARESVRFGMVTPGVRHNVSFRLRLEYARGWPEPAARLFPRSTPVQEVAAALWAWETFGGVGARTRRGFGAINLVARDGVRIDPPAAEQLGQRLADECARHVVHGHVPPGVPSLRPSLGQACRLVWRPGDDWRWPDPLAAWRFLIDSLAAFRQQRLPGQDTPGRSRWPEPDAIRRLTKVWLQPHHAPRREAPTKFPRAAFGLPIVVHFKDRADPPDTAIQGVKAGLDRLASPLILRPLLCLAGDRRIAAGLALVLAGPAQPPGGLGLADGRNVIPIPSEPLTVAEARQLGLNLPGSPADPNAPVDVLQAFLNFLDERSR